MADQSDNSDQSNVRRKAPKKTGTQPKAKAAKKPLSKPGVQEVKGGAGKGAKKSTHAAKKASGAKTSATRKAGPKSIPKGTTTKSKDKKGGGKKHAAKRAPVKESKARKQKIK
jgi:hypothetical protein